MRKHWIMSCLLSASVVGCATGGLPGTGTKFAGQTQTQAQQFAAMQQSAAPPQQTWTQKVTSVFKGSPNQTPAPANAAGSLATDPISLGYSSSPPNADLYISMAKMSDQGGNAAHARSMYQQALTLQPDHLDGMLSLARLEDREGQLDAALHYYKQAVHHHPQSAKALNDLSLCFARRGQVAEALPPLEQAIRLAPSKQLYRNNIAKVLIELNQLDGAMQNLVVVHPPAIAQYNMGVLLHERNRDQEAAGYLTAAMQTDPALQPASALLAELSPAAAPVQHAVPTAQAANGYPSTGAISVSPQFQSGPVQSAPVQSVPAETAQRPVGYGPMMAPPVR